VKIRLPTISYILNRAPFEKVLFMLVLRFSYSFRRPSRCRERYVFRYESNCSCRDARRFSVFASKASVLTFLER
jgi:hypothetical protein